MKKYDYLVVGAGFAGCTAAERIANLLNKKVLVVEKRGHLGGNCYDLRDEYGILIQKYGPHIFHTKIKRVWQYLSGFTDWNNYVHRVLAHVRGLDIYLPINLASMEILFKRKFSGDQLREFLQQRQVKLTNINNSRDVAVSQVGEELYELFFKNYSKKQWGIYPDKLAAEVLKRIPVRFNRDTRYFTDPFQGIPLSGYNKIFTKMVNNPNIDIIFQTDYKDLVKSVNFRYLIYTGPIDYYFDYKYGPLPYRSLKFVFKTIDQEQFQAAAVVNYPNKYKYTRITEFKHFYLQEHDKTTICYEYPGEGGDPSYPIPSVETKKLYQKYFNQAQGLKNVFFVGRLAQYQYLNMDQVVNNSLEMVDRLRSFG